MYNQRKARTQKIILKEIPSKCKKYFGNNGLVKLIATLNKSNEI